MDFSSNICVADNHRQLMQHLMQMPHLISHYPEPEARRLERAIGQQKGLPEECVVVTAGATEALYLIAQAFDERAVIPGACFREYEDACRMFGRETDFPSVVPSEPWGGVLWVCSPNNPDGRLPENMALRRLCEEGQKMVIDVSYEGYTDGEVMDDATALQLPWCIMVHSFTKTYGVPGLRLGYIVARPRLAAAIRRCMRPWSVSPLAEEAGLFLLAHGELKCRPDLGEARRLRRQLLQTGCVDVEPTSTSFMLCRLKYGHAAGLKEHLAREHRMLVRDASNFRGLTPQHFRVAARSREEDDVLVEAVCGYVSDIEKQ